MITHRSLGFSILVILCFQAAAWASGPSVAQIVYREGRPVVFRDGRRLWDPVEFGFPIENLDFIRNDHESLVEIRTEPHTGAGAAIIAGPRTTISFGLSALGDEQHGILELMSGAVTITVGPASGLSELGEKSWFSVKTERIVIDAGSASFDVTVSPRGDVLVTTRNGVVECRLDDDRVLFSRPGHAVELDAEGAYRNVPVSVARLEEFRSRWMADRTAALRAESERVTRGYAEQYERVRSRFNEQYAALFSRRDILDTWMRESGQGRIGSAVDVEREKSEIIAYLVDIRPTLARFEKVYYRLLELREFATDGSAADATARLTANFFRGVDADRRVVEQRMVTVRHVLKMYAHRNDGPAAY